MHARLTLSAARPSEANAALATMRGKSECRWRMRFLAARSGRRFVYLSITAAESRCQIDHRRRHTATQSDRTGTFSPQRSGTGQAVRLILRGYVNSDGLAVELRWVGAKSADRDLPMPRLRQ